MNHTLSEQSLACKHAKEFLIRIDSKDNELIDKLECAAQTLAALNWTKHLPDEGREQFWENTLDLIADWLESGAIDKMIPKKDEFLSKTYDVIQSQSAELKEKEKRIAELEEGLRGAANVLRIATLIDKSNTCEKAMVQAESLLNKTN